MSQSTVVRRRRSTDEVRRRLLDAAHELFAAGGYEATTLRQIAESAEVSLSVLFRHFDSKSRLLVETVIEPFGEFVDTLAAALDDSVEERRPEQFVTYLFQALLPHRDALRAVLSTLTSADGDHLMRELGARLDEPFARIRSFAVVSAPVPAEDVDAEGTELVVRLVVGTVTTLVVLDDWFLSSVTTAGRARLVEVVARMTVRRLRHRRPPAEQVSSPDDAGNDSSRGAPVTPTSATDSPTDGAARRRKPEEVREALLRAARELSLDKGYAATSYLDIADAAHTSKSALYRHFGSKSNLLIEAGLDPFAEAFSSRTRRWTQVAQQRRRAHQPEYVADLFRTLVDNRPLVRGLMGVANEPSGREVDRAVASWFDEMFAESLDLQQTGQGVRGERYEPDLRMRAVVAMLFAASTLDDWFLPQDDRAPQQDLVVHLISDLISAGRGKKR